MQLQRDGFSGSWRVVAPERIKRLERVAQGCPFCAGNEDVTPAETFRINGEHSAGWAARSFPNLYPLAAVHEVLVPTPRHATSLRELTVDELVVMLELWCGRLEFHADQAGDDAYVHLFVNDGAQAGASVPHVHAQLMRVPTSEYLSGLLDRVRDPETCAACTLVNTAEGDERCVSRVDGLVLAVPEVPRLSGSMILTPEAHGHPFGAERALAGMMHTALRALPPHDFNVVVVIHPASPVHWYIEFIPRHGQLAGAELGLNITVSMTDPRADAEAARTRIRS